MTIMLRLVLPLVFTLGLTACLGPPNYEEFYSHRAPVKYEPTDQAVLSYAPFGLEETYRLLFDGFLIVGSVSFNGTYDDPEYFRDFGRKVGADVVLYKFSNERTRTHQGTMSLPDTQTSYVDGYSAYGSYSGTVTTYGTKDVPYRYDVTRADQDVLFLKRMDEGAKAPWEYTKSDFAGLVPVTEYAGVWRDRDYEIEILDADSKWSLGFIRSVAPGLNRDMEKLNPSLRWRPGDLKMRLNRKVGSALYLMGDKHPEITTFSINRFGHLEIKVLFDTGRTRVFSFERVE